MNRAIRSLISWWLRRHPPLARVPAWKQAQEAEKRAKARGCTQALHRAREAKRAAINANLRGVA